VSPTKKESEREQERAKHGTIDVARNGLYRHLGHPHPFQLMVHVDRVMDNAVYAYDQRHPN
jgi:hypothetical protein